jgi:hypothetical protein
MVVVTGEKILETVLRIVVEHLHQLIAAHLLPWTTGT